MKQKVVKEKSYAGVVSEKILKNTRFKKCNFSHAYFGRPRGEQGPKINFSQLHVSFFRCRFDNANFKGAVGVSERQFEDCYDLQYATHIPECLKAWAKESPGSTSPEKVTAYQKAGVTNKSIKPSPQWRITDFFPKVQSSDSECGEESTRSFSQ